MNLPWHFRIGSGMLVFTMLVISNVHLSEASGLPNACPHLERLFARMDTHMPVASPPGLQHFLGDSVAITLKRQDIIDFLEATADDGITLLRATALFTRWVRSRGLPVFATGETIETAVRTGFSLGLMFPVDHIAYFFYVPNDSIKGDFQAHIRVIYTRNYIYRFEKDIFDADVLVRGQEIRYNKPEGTFRKGYLVTTDVYYNDQTVEYTNVQGIAGQKHGALGFLQKVFFFLPKTLNGLTLKDNDLIIDAFINQRVSGFEQKPRYRVRRGSP